MFYTKEQEEIIKERVRIISMWISGFLFKTPILFFIRW